MKIIKINPKNPQQEVIDDAVDVLKNGGVVVYPTDTCYGFGADMTNIFAIEKIYRIKGRKYRKPLSMIVKNIQQIEKYALIEAQQKTILGNNLPGPFTFILLNINYRSIKQSSLGIRIPNYPVTQAIADKFHRPYATTSANKSGEEPCYSVSCILKQLAKNKYMPDLILDAGILPQNSPSTVVSMTGEKPQVLRSGSQKLII
mgnify:CR=1 FL=1